MKRAILLSTALLLLGMLAACCPCEQSTSDRPAHPRTEITLSSGGGVSGFISGNTILPDRTVLEWNGMPGKRERVDTLGRLESEAYALLLDTLYAQDPVTIRQQESGNMTTTLRMPSGDEVWTWSWPGMRSREEDVPAALRIMRNAVWQAIESLRTGDDDTTPKN